MPQTIQKILTYNILTYILEDDEDMHEVLKNVLKAKNVPEDMIEITHDPSQFLEKLNSDINICVIDHRLSLGVTGLDIIREVKKKNKDSYVIIITGQSDYRIVAKYLREGADDYVDKNENNGDYYDDFVASVLKGVNMATERIEELKEREQFRREMLQRGQETQSLISRLKKG